VVAPRPQAKVMAPRPTRLEDAASVTGEFKPAGSPVKPLYEQINDTNKAVRQLQTMAGLSADKQTLAAPTTAQLANSLKVATKSWKLIEKAVRERSELTLELETRLARVAQLETKMECVTKLNKALHDRALQAEERVRAVERRMSELEAKVMGPQGASHAYHNTVRY
jgi:predicted nuclease with TOPRIM domain